MPEDYLAHNFKRHSATACMGGSVTSEIVRSQMYTDKVTGLSDNRPGGLVTNRKYPNMCIEFICPNIFFETIGNFLRDKNDFLVSTTFGVMNDQLPVLNITGSQFQNFPNTHTSTGH